MPKVSVVMSVYNGKKYLRESVDSVLNQTYKDFEFIIVNDGSTDRTSELLARYRDKRIKIISNLQRLGQARSLNIGISKACGNYIGRMDIDDLSLPERLEKQVNFLDNNPDFGMVGTDHYEIGENGERIFSEIELPLSDGEVRKRIFSFNPFIHTSIMIRKIVFKKVGVYDEEFKYAQDYELWFRVMRYFKVSNLEDKLVMLRRDYTSVSFDSKIMKEKLEYYLLAVKKGIKYLRPPLYCYVFLIKPWLRTRFPGLVWRRARKARTTKIATIGSLTDRAKEAYFLVKNIPNIDEKKLLDVGCASGDIAVSAKYSLGLDIDISNLKAAKDHGFRDDIVVADAEELPLKTRYFDVVTAFDVVEHVSDDQQMINEIERVLKDEGELILSTPSKGFIYKLLDWQSWIRTHRHYSLGEMEKLFHNIIITKAYKRGFIIEPIFGLLILPFNFIDKFIFLRNPGPLSSVFRKIWSPFLNIEYELQRKLKINYGQTIFILGLKKASS